MSIFHCSNYDSFDEALVGFSEYCRMSDLTVGLNHTEEAFLASCCGFSNDRDSLKYALKSLYCTREEEFEVFDKCFNVFWGKRKHEYAHKTNNNRTHTNVTKKANASLVMMGFNPNGKEPEKEEEDAKSISGASNMESLKMTDFSKISMIDNQILDELTEQLLRQLNHRLKRKHQTTKKGKIDIRKSIRNNLANGDDLIKLVRKNRKLEKYRINLLLDVSGSMDKYSFFLLKFIWSLKSNIKGIEAFVFSTKLIRVTEYIHKNQLDHTLWEMTQYADNWSSGTKIGECLKQFNDQYAKRILNGKSITIVLSDGLDNGDEELLASELYKIKLRTSKLVWLNPLKGSRDYEPLAKGMKAALPQLDIFESAHNFDSLLKLENILADV